MKMKAYVFPGQGAQFEGMGRDLYENNDLARNVFDQADEILGYKLSEVMFSGSVDDLKQTKITQPALFVHSIACMKAHLTEFDGFAVAGHSLGEFTALVASGSLSFEDGLSLVYQRAMAMQDACELSEGTMAAVLGLADEIVEEVCSAIMDDIVVAANYNCPGQLVISGSVSGLQKAETQLKEKGAKRVLVLQVGGAFHSPLMEPAREKLAASIENTNFNVPLCPIYQNYTATKETNPEVIKKNLIDQLTGPVKWTQSVKHMYADGINHFVEVGGTGKVLSGLIKKIAPDAETSSLI